MRTAWQFIFGRFIPARLLTAAAVCLTISLLMPLWATARTLVVRPDGRGDYKTIQGALDEAKKGYVIQLAPGTYRGAGNVNLDFLGLKIKLVGDPARPGSRIIDCRGGDGTWRAIHLQNGEGRGTIIEGITFIGDPTVGEYPLEHSGGLILCQGASPIIRNCVFEGGRAYRGGAINLERSNAEISRCQFRDNSAEVGGAIMASAGAAVIRECHLEANHAARGGAIYVLLSNMVITACTVTDNTAGVGGGIACDERSTLLLDRLVVTNNYASYGGGVSVSDSKLDLHHCTLALNSGGSGGALLLRGNAKATVVGSILAFSPKGQGIASALDTELDIKCTLIFGNADGDWVQSATALLDQNDNQQTDPGFVNAAKGNFALRPDSVGRDAVCGVMGALP